MRGGEKWKGLLSPQSLLSQGLCGFGGSMIGQIKKVAGSFAQRPSSSPSVFHLFRLVDKKIHVLFLGQNLFYFFISPFLNSYHGLAFVYNRDCSIRPDFLKLRCADKVYFLDLFNL